MRDLSALNLLSTRLEHAIITESSFIEIGETLILFLCFLRCGYLVYKSQLRIGRGFWVMSALIFFMVIRRELNFVPDMWVTKQTIWWGRHYDWWEDSFLLLLALIIIAKLKL